jgi:hypothetical protein
MLRVTGADNSSVTLRTISDGIKVEPGVDSNGDGTVDLVINPTREALLT